MTTNKNLRTEESTRQASENIAYDVEQFLKKGGVIQVDDKEPGKIKGTMREVAGDNWI